VVNTVRMSGAWPRRRGRQGDKGMTAKQTPARRGVNETTVPPSLRLCN